MCTFHVVCIDFQHRLGVHAGFLRGAEILVGHLRLSFLGTGLYQHPTSKGSCSLIVEDIFIELMTGTVSCMVGDERVVVDMLLFVGNDTAAAIALSTLSHKVEVQLVACHTIVQRDDIMIHATISLLLDIDIADTSVLMMRLLQTVKVQFGIVAHKTLNDLCGQKATVVGSMVTKEEFGFCTFLQYNEHATIHHEVNITAQDIDDLNSTVKDHILRYIDEKTILCQHGIEVGDGIIVFTSQMVIEVIGVFLQ